MASLAAALEKLPSLAVMRLRGNCIGDEGAAALSSAVAGSGLQELDVGHNEVCKLPTRSSAPHG